MNKELLIKMYQAWRYGEPGAIEQLCDLLDEWGSVAIRFLLEDVHCRKSMIFQQQISTDAMPGGERIIPVHAVYIETGNRAYTFRPSPAAAMIVTANSPLVVAVGHRGGDMGFMSVFVEYAYDSPTSEVAKDPAELRRFAAGESSPPPRQ